jgi:hypothetical protein
MKPVSAITGATGDRILDDPLVDRFLRGRDGGGGSQRNAVTRRLGGFGTPS